LGDVCAFDPAYQAKWFSWRPQKALLSSNTEYACNRTDSQQSDWCAVKACLEILALPEDAAIAMTGETKRVARAKEWVRLSRPIPFVVCHARHWCIFQQATHRVFFVTPQAFNSDINNSSVPLAQIVCLVFDEAHKATGKPSASITIFITLFVLPLQEISPTSRS